MDILILLGKAALVAFALANVVLPLISERRNLRFVWQVWGRFRFGMFFQCFGVLLITAMVCASLALLVPPLKYGWLNIFIEGGGNPLVAPVMEGSQSANSLIRLLVPIFFGAVILVLPFLAKYEEVMFREGHEKWNEIIWQSIKFGPIHCLIGVPLTAGLALILVGLFYGYHYKRAYEQSVPKFGPLVAREEALLTSTAYHTMFNTIVVGSLLLFALFAI